MPAVRVSRRRRSSLALSLQPVKAGIYGAAARPVTFAPNVTPVSYVEPDSPTSSTTPDPPSPTSAIFPPSQTPAPPPTRRRVPPGKRRSLGYIPRPPNAFMLFRADFVRQKHVPGSIETNHGSLSKIIGNCWRSLPLDEKKVWEVKAKHAKAEHKARYPNYRFKPIHGKHKDKKKDKTAGASASALEDERRCEEVAQLLLEGKKGDELAAAVRHLDLRLQRGAGAGEDDVYGNGYGQTNGHGYGHRRSSSVPLPNDYYPSYPTPQTQTQFQFQYQNQNQYQFQQSYQSNILIPSVPTFPSRPSTPISALARHQHQQQQQQQRMMLGQRRASSARPALMHRSWTMPSTTTTALSLTRDDSPLPDVDTSLFEPSFLGAADGSGFAFPTHSSTSSSTSASTSSSSSSSGTGMLMNFDDFSSSLLSPGQSHTHSQRVRRMELELGPGPLEGISPHDSVQVQGVYAPSMAGMDSPDLGQFGWMSLDPSASSSTSQTTSSGPSTVYTGSPGSATGSLPQSQSQSGSQVQGLQLHAPQPQPASIIPASVMNPTGTGGGTGGEEGSFRAIWKEFTGASFSAPSGDYTMGHSHPLGLGLGVDGLGFGMDGEGLGLDFSQHSQHSQQHHGDGHGEGEGEFGYGGMWGGERTFGQGYFGVGVGVMQE